MSFPIVGVGASAGGLEAFTQLLKSLPPNTGMGFVLVQHLDPEHESALTQILARVTSLPVEEITHNRSVQPDRIYVIPRDTNLSIVRGVLKLEPRGRTRVPHRPIDSFFESLAQDHGHQAIGIVLSGTGSDGTLGLEAIKAEGGITFAQDDSAKHDSMPRSAVAAGCVDVVLAPAGMGQELARIAKHPYAAGQPLALSMRAEEDRAQATEHQEDLTPLPSGGRGTPPNGSSQARTEAATSSGADEGYKKVLLLLRDHAGVDFSLYKSTTIQRRIARRMILTKHNTLAEYAGHLRSNANELAALYSDVLISVTSFFRNPEMFEVLERTVLPELIKQPGDNPLRCWVLGCSTGQEAYSIAMSFVETAEKAPRTRNLQIFATDLNDVLLEKARHGLYAKSLAEEIAPQRLRRFFVEEDGGYRVSKMLRDMVVFARQNLIADPPFSRMDLVSCRNLLIYLEPTLQKKALPTFHYALKPNGYLLLGASESIGSFTDLFEPVDKKYKIYSKKPAPTPGLYLRVGRAHGEPLPPAHLPVPTRPASMEPPEGPRGELAAQREADRITVNRFAPPGVLVNSDLQVVQFRGPTSAYLQPPAGRATFDVLKMAREGLMLPLRAACDEARKENKAVRKPNVRVKQDSQTRRVNLEVIPLAKLGERCFLILFEEARESPRADHVPTVEPPEHLVDKEQELSRIGELENDRAEMRAYLQSMQEQHEAANEELQAANEEVQSANEELQSVNEELETSKEELESANEELTTVNEEMNQRNLELNRLNGDLINLQSSTQLAVVLLGRGLTIRRFTPQAQKLFDLLATDVGRPIGQLRHTFLYAPPADNSNAAAESRTSAVDLESIVAEVLSSLHHQECDVRDRTGRWYSMRVYPYVTVENNVDGAVVVLVDIDALKRGEQAIIRSRDFAENTLQTLREPLLVLDSQLRVQTANRAFYSTFRVKPIETTGRLIYELGNHQWDIPRLRELLEEVLPQRGDVADFLVERDFPDGLGRRVMLLNARRIRDPERMSERILVAIEDITERKQAEDALRESHSQLELHVEDLSRFNDAAVGREIRMIALKKDINELCRRYGEPVRFPLDFEQDAEVRDGRPDVNENDPL